MARLLLVAMLAVGALGLVARAPADAASRTVTKTFSNTSSIRIPEGDPTTTVGPASPYPSEITVAGLKRGRVLDVNLKLNDYSHTWPADIDVLLVGPRGQTAIVMSDAGAEVNDIDLILDDEATDPLPNFATSPTSGRYKPTNEVDEHEDSFPSPAPSASGESRLSVFDGTNPNGTWRLYVVDDAVPDGGEFAGGWSLVIKARVRG